MKDGGTLGHAEKAARDLEWGELCEALARRAAGPCAASRLLTLAPASTRDEANGRATLAREALLALREGEPIPCGAVLDVAPMIERARVSGTLGGVELFAVGKALTQAREVRSFVRARGGRYPALLRELDSDEGLTSLERSILDAIEPGGRISDDASSALRGARHAVIAARRHLTEKLRHAMAAHADVLRESGPVERDGRYGLPVRADAHREVPGIVLGASATSATIYVEPPELSLVTNRVRLAEATVAREEERVLAELSHALAARAAAVQGAFEAAVRADMLASIARFGRDTGGVVLPLDEAPGLELYAMRHPLLCEQQAALPEPARGEVVPNDLYARPFEALVISGPNAGGKTVALKCLGLAALMGKCGLPLPVDGRSRLGFSELVLTDVGDRQSLERSLSTFSAHVASYASILAAAREGALVLLDEVAGSTDPEEGAALAVALLEALVARGASVAVTTHYERLKHLAAEDPRFSNAAVGFDFARMMPTFALRHGVAGGSAALAAALRYGLPATVVARAEELVPEESLRREVLLAELETEAALMRAARAEADRDLARAASLRDEAERERSAVRAKERKKLDDEAAELRYAIKGARQKLRDLDGTLREGPRAIGAKDATRIVDEAAKVVSLGGPVVKAARALDENSAGAASLDPAALRVGMRVSVARLGQVATLVELADRGFARVQAGAFSVRVPVSELSPAPRDEPKGKGSRGNPEREKSLLAPREAASPFDGGALAPTPSAALRTSDNTCDLRGLRVDEALERLDRFIDGALRAGDRVAFVLHGHGTGALRQAVREHLALSEHVGERRPANLDEGGDAFTVFWLR